MARRLLTVGLVLAVLAVAGAVVLVVKYATASRGDSGPVGMPSLPKTGAYVTGSLPSENGRAAVAAANREIPIVLSYDYRDLAGSLSRALAQTTGSFRTTLQSEFTTTVEPQATTNEDVATSSIRGASYVSSASNGSVTCLIFVDQTLNRAKPSAGAPARQVDEDRVVVTMTRIRGQWLISALTPI